MPLRPTALLRYLLIPALILVGVVTLDTPPHFAAVAVQNRVGEIDNNSMTAIRGNVRGEAQAQYDRGAVDSSFRLENVIMAFKPSADQEAALDALLSSQQDRSSPNYHRWLTPEEYAGRFGLTESDVAKVVSWLEDQGFTINQTARSRTWVSFAGTAAQVASAFHTEIHRYAMNGETHYANSSDPSVPSALASVVLGFHALNDFHPRPRVAVRVRRVVPEFTSSISGSHFLTPNDFATIYSVEALYSAGYTGSGEKIAVMGQTDFALSDIQAFRTASGLSTNNPVTLLVGLTDPGTSSGDLVEADLDLEWSGGVAPSSPILYVNSTDAFTSLQYAIDQDLAPVLSISYGGCEADIGAAFSNVLSNAAKQGNSQGMTLVSAAGDDGAADCDIGTPTSPPTIATHGLAVDIPAAIPNFTGVGGTQFSEGSGTYWNSTNNAQMGSAMSYIPEVVWNETVQDGSLAASGGGVSTFFAKPSWQTGTGVPADGKRDVPDISFNASAAHDPYLICTSGSCVNGYRATDNSLQVVGGTSAGAPSFAGVMAIIDQRQKGAQGNANPNLYSIAAGAPGAFHDITSGNNMVPCKAGSTNCPPSGELGYNAAAGYDLATGLGSINAYNLATNWSGKSTPPPPDFQIAVSPSSLTLSPGGSSSSTVTITGANGFDGAVTFAVTVSSTLSGVTAATAASVTGSGTTTLAINASSAARLLPPGRFSGPGAWLKLALLLTFGAGFGVLRMRLRWPAFGMASCRPVQARVWLGLALAGLLAAGISCGGGSSPSTSPNTSTAEAGTITVQATSGALGHSASVTVNVN